MAMVTSQWEVGHSEVMDWGNVQVVLVSVQAMDSDSDCHSRAMGSRQLESGLALGLELESG